MSFIKIGKDIFQNGEQFKYSVMQTLEVSSISRETHTLWTRLTLAHENLTHYSDVSVFGGNNILQG